VFSWSRKRGGKYRCSLLLLRGCDYGVRRNGRKKRSPRRERSTHRPVPAPEPGGPRQARTGGPYLIGRGTQEHPREIDRGIHPMRPTPRQSPFANIHVTVLIAFIAVILASYIKENPYDSASQLQGLGYTHRTLRPSNMPTAQYQSCISNWYAQHKGHPLIHPYVYIYTGRLRRRPARRLHGPHESLRVGLQQGEKDHGKRNTVVNCKKKKKTNNKVD
jgi:hypothetical protein